MKLLESIKRRWVIWVWTHTPTCEEMSRLVSESFEQPLSWKVKCRMRLHFVICVWCKRYAKHLKFLHQAANGLEAHLSEPSRNELSPAARERIKARIRESHGH